MFGPVDASPSAPPSFTTTWSMSQIDRLVLWIAPGTIELNEVVMLHVEPVVVLPVAVHPTTIGNETVWVVPP